MITYENYVQYLKDNDGDFICNETMHNAEKKERRRRHCFDRAKKLEEYDLSKYKTREQAEAALKIQGEELVVGCGGIVFILLSSIISWIIQKLLTKQFG